MTEKKQRLRKATLRFIINNMNLQRKRLEPFNLNSIQENTLKGLVQIAYNLELGQNEHIPNYLAVEIDDDMMNCFNTSFDDLGYEIISLGNDAVLRDKLENTILAQ